MPRFLPDTSCMVAFSCAWHLHNERSVREIEQRLDRGETLVVAAPALIESYSVLTRLPPPHRLSPATSWALLEANFLSHAKIVALDADDYRDLLQHAPSRDIAGGRIYDAVILACARRAQVDVVLTFNERQLAPLTEAGTQIVIPGNIDE